MEEEPRMCLIRFRTKYMEENNWPSPEIGHPGNKASLRFLN
uniref:Uncharacterized protein n=1 Tax=Accipiter nisus TaxID=211598 RepID=A0A8B9RY05_9AVES